MNQRFARPPEGLVALGGGRRRERVIDHGRLQFLRALVTGAEFSKLNGQLLGVYINDSGTTPPGAGRFVPAEKFRKAWEGMTRDFIEVLP